MGWDQTNFTLQDAVDTCTSLSGEIEDCPLFTIISEAEQGECKFELPDALVNENVTGPVDTLPGNVALAWGPEPANDTPSSAATTTSSVSSIPLPTLSYSAGSTASVSGSVVPGNVFRGSSAAATSTSTVEVKAADVTSTVTASVSLETESTSTIISTEDSGLVIVSEIVYEEEITYVTEVTTTTVYVTPTSVPDARRDIHAHQHQRLRHKH